MSYQGLQASGFYHLCYKKKLSSFNDVTKSLRVTIVTAKIISGNMAIKNHLVCPVN